MEIKLGKIKPEVALSVALGALGLVQAVLTNKKEANEKQTLKEEILKEITKEMSDKNN